MTTLVCQTLVNSLEQRVNFNHNKRYHVGCISPYLLMVNSPAGTFTFKIFKNSTEIFSKNFNSNDIKASFETSNDFAHVFYPVIPDQPLFLDRGEYTFRIEQSGYSPTQSTFLAWIQQHENKQVNMDYEPFDDSENTFSFRIKTYRQGIL
jgi:hypothetical protein